MNRGVRVKVTPPRLLRSFALKKKFQGLSGIYHYNLGLFESFPLFILFFILLLITAILKDSTFLYSLSSALMLYLLITFFLIKSQVKRVRVRRIMKETVFENEMTFVTYKVSNPTNFKLSNIHFVDIFAATEDGVVTFEIERINANTIYQKDIEIKVNTGMGFKETGPLMTYISDPLNLFRFDIEYQQLEMMNVLPKVNELPISDEVNDTHSNLGGKYNIQVRGESSNFIGTKEYVPGEPIKKVNWKLSLKQHKLILNEYEKDTNAKVLIILDLDKIKHFGKGAHSTWEYLKDICLSVANMHNHSGNLVSVISQNFFIHYQTGRSHLELLEKTIATQGLSDKKEYAYPLSHVIERDTNVFYLSTFVQALRSIEDYEILRRTSSFNKVRLFLIDPYKYYNKPEHKEFFVLLSSLKKITDEKLLPYLKKNQSNNFKYNIIRINNENCYIEDLRTDDL